MISPTAIDHTCLLVTDLSRAREHFEKLFDFQITTREGVPTTLVVESPAIRFFLTETSTDASAFLPMQHLSFRVDDLEEVIGRLKTAGIEGFNVGQVDFLRRDNYRWCEWRGPNRIRLECVELL